MTDKKNSNIRLIKSNKKLEEELNKEKITHDQKLSDHANALNDLIIENPNTINNIVSIVFSDNTFRLWCSDEEMKDTEMIGLLTIVKQKIIDSL